MRRLARRPWQHGQLFYDNNAQTADALPAVFGMQSTGNQQRESKKHAMKIFDFRFRPNTRAILDGIAKSTMFKEWSDANNFDQFPAETLPQIVEGLKARGVEGCVVTGRDCSTTYGFPDNNASVLEFCQSFPEMFHGFWGIDPHKGMDAVRTIEHVVKEHGMKGVALDPYLAHIPASAARFYPIYAKCCELNVPVFITMAPPPNVQGALIEYTDPRDVEKAAHDFPELNFIMSHAGYPFVEEAIFVVMRNKNVYMDLSEYELAPMADRYVEALNKGWIDRKVVFASAHPFVEQSAAIKIYNEMPISDEVRARVFWDNAARLLKLA